ncbi:MAG: transcription-repair coupling factor [Thermacetogeniaceae bacterium]
MRDIFKKIPEYRDAVSALRESRVPALVSGLHGPCKALLAAAIYEDAGCRGALLVVVPGDEEARAWEADLQSLLPDRDVLVFDAADPLHFEVVASDREPAAGRLQVLAALSGEEGAPPVVVAPVDSLLSRLIPPSVWMGAAVRLRAGEEFDQGDLCERLVRSGYERSHLVESPGQFAVRGSILDVFPFCGKAVRLEFWGDEVTSIRELDVETQRSRQPLEEAVIWPGREFIYDPELAEAAAARIQEAYRSRRGQVKGRSAQANLRQRFERLLEMAAEGNSGSMHLVQPYFYPEPASLLDYLPPGSLVVLDEPRRCQERCRQRIALLESEYRHLLQEGRALTPWQEHYFGEEELFGKLGGACQIAMAEILTAPGCLEPKATVSFVAKEMQPFLGRPDLLAPELRRWLRGGTSVLVLVPSEERLPQLERELKAQELAFIRSESWQRSLKPGRLHVGVGTLSRGFELPGRLAVVTPGELYGRKHLARRKRLEPRGKADAMPDLSPGDYVVHVHHGIGRFIGVREMESEGRKRDYLEVAYAGGDRLYIPVDQMSLVQKYIAPDGHVPRLSRLGGTEWARQKQRVKRRLKELAKELLELYTKRLETPGYAFSPDTAWQQEFEAAFPYEETPDQKRAIAEVKADMESPRAMDRLICGDVGFGKTEVAIRAAFKAVQDGKQVAVLVPTTVLAQQHYRTFKERFAGYPVRVEVLSRFRSPKEQKEVVEAVSKGLVDVVIGTHRLLSDDVRFKDLGLLIIDEEQRFGVAHKEKLKMLRTNVDVLTLTATPIPRTLQMSLSGVRDMSLIETPPEDRLPVQTYVLEFDPEVIRDAIRREIQRGGQVFYVHNRVETIERRAAYLQGLVPEASFRVAHGRMKEEELENVMWDFLNGKFDCLVCTTIIENGLDMPNVNTLIVERADCFGLAQLYQLRGRVGRSNRLAYAYFTFERDKVLTEDAEKRLRALQEFTEFGSGFRLALRDLEIRGAGNLLGPEQHGHIAAVGFELYNQLLREAVSELKGEKVEEEAAPPPPAWELRLDAYIPDDYIPDARQKVELYRRLAMVDSFDALDDLREEVRDRFGPMPEPVSYLFKLTELRLRAREMSISEVQHLDHTMVVRFSDGAKPGRGELKRWARVFGRRLAFSAVGGLEARIDTRGLSPGHLVEMLGEVMS